MTTPATTTPFCIVTEDDCVLEKDLTQSDAELALTRYLGLGEDCYIGNSADYPDAVNEAPLLTATKVPGNRRSAMLPRYMGLYMMVFENSLYEQLGALSEGYKGGMWEMYELSNGGFYMAPKSPDKLVIDAPNFFTGELSADAAGITACLYVYCHLAASVRNENARQAFCDLYHNLREWVLTHQEAGNILAACD